MNVNQLKTRIFILKSIDIVLLIALMIAGIFSVFYAENKELMIISCFIGLYLANTFGRMTVKKVALMHVQINVLNREKKTEEQRTLLGTRHTKVSSTRINPTNKAA